MGMSEEAKILEAFFRKWVRLAKITLVVSLAALVTGAIGLTTMMGITPSPHIQQPPKIRITKVRVVAHERVPAFEVYLESDVWPVRVELFYMNKTVMDEENIIRGKAIDSMLVNSSADVPVYLSPFLNPYGWWFFWWWSLNIYPGHYTIVASHGEHFTAKTLFIKGADLVIEEAEPRISYGLTDWGVGWGVNNITLTVKNTGDCPAYIGSIGSIVLYIPSLNETLLFSADVIISPSDTKVFIAKYSGWELPLSQPDTYDATIIISLGFKNWTYETTITLPTPDLVVKRAIFRLEYDEFWDEWRLKRVILTVENKGEVPAYIFEIGITIPDVDEDHITYWDPVTVAPGETETLVLEPYYFVIEEPGTYNVIITIDIGYTTITYETTLTVG